MMLLSFFCGACFAIACAQTARAWWYSTLYKGSLDYIAATKQIPESLAQPAQVSTPVYTWDDSQQHKVN